MSERVERRQQFRSGFRTKKDAQRALTAALRAVDTGSYVDPSKQTLAHYLLDEWLPARKPKQRTGRRHRGQVSLGTWSSYKGDLQAHVIPRIGDIRLQALTPADLNRLYDELEESGGRGGRGLSGKTVANVHGVLHKALADAVKQDKVVRNVADAVDPPKASKPRTDVWTVEELRAFLLHVHGDRLYAAWLLFATTGMRRGEVAGLTWPDLDLDGGTARIEWTLGVVDSKPTWKPRPKSEAGERSMSLDPSTVQALREYRKQQSEERLACGAAWQHWREDWQGEAREDVVFTWPDGALINPQRLTKWFTRHCRDAGLPAIRLHDVRHTYATAALASATGWHDVKVISKRLGHASVGITLDTYSHVLPVADEQAAHTLARVILGK
jgi:integrase